MKNFLTILLLSRGVPMLLAGDEVKRTQRGNNNAYNQNNETSWFDWTIVATNQEMLQFVQRLIAFRKAHPALSQPTFYTGVIGERGIADIAWHGTTLGKPGFNDPGARALACTIAGVDRAPDLHVMMNMFWEPLTFELPARTWRTVIDTFAASPADLPDEIGAASALQDHSVVQGRSIVVVASR
jgi:isoamylase